MSSDKDKESKGPNFQIRPTTPGDLQKLGIDMQDQKAVDRLRERFGEDVKGKVDDTYAPVPPSSREPGSSRGLTRTDSTRIDAHLVSTLSLVTSYLPLTRMNDQTTHGIINEIVGIASKTGGCPPKLIRHIGALMYFIKCHPPDLFQLAYKNFRNDREFMGSLVQWLMGKRFEINISGQNIMWEFSDDEYNLRRFLDSDFPSIPCNIQREGRPALESFILFRNFLEAFLYQQLRIPLR